MPLRTRGPQFHCWMCHCRNTHWLCPYLMVFFYFGVWFFCRMLVLCLKGIGHDVFWASNERKRVYPLQTECMAMPGQHGNSRTQWPISYICAKNVFKPIWHYLFVKVQWCQRNNFLFLPCQLTYYAWEHDKMPRKQQCHNSAALVLSLRILITENLEVPRNKTKLSSIAYTYIYPSGYVGSRSYLQECLKQRFSYRE